MYAKSLKIKTAKTKTALPSVLAFFFGMVVPTIIFQQPALADLVLPPHGAVLHGPSTGSFNYDGSEIDQVFDKYDFKYRVKTTTKILTGGHPHKFKKGDIVKFKTRSFLELEDFTVGADPMVTMGSVQTPPAAPQLNTVSEDKLYNRTYDWTVDLKGGLAQFLYDDPTKPWSIRVIDNKDRKTFDVEAKPYGIGGSVQFTENSTDKVTAITPGNTEFKVSTTTTVGDVFGNQAFFYNAGQIDVTGWFKITDHMDVDATGLLVNDNEYFLSYDGLETGTEAYENLGVVFDSESYDRFTVRAATVPEPSALLLGAAGLLFINGKRLKRKNV